MSAIDRQDVAGRIHAMRRLGSAARARALGTTVGTLDRIVCSLSASEETYRRILPRLEALEKVFRELVPVDDADDTEASLVAYREKRKVAVAEEISAKQQFAERVCAAIDAGRGTS